MSGRVVVIGAGIGGLVAAARLAQAGIETIVLEGRTTAGGLASSLTIDGLSFDAGPYILLDKEGLAWAMEAIGLDVSRELGLTRVDNLYRVTTSEEIEVCIYGDLEKTCEALDRQWPGVSRAYRAFVAEASRLYQRLTHLRFESVPSVATVLRAAGLRGGLFLRRSLQQVLRSSGLPAPVQEALAIWTHIAGQRIEEAPAPMAFVPAVIHTVGAYYPRSGIASIPNAVFTHAEKAGVEFRFQKVVSKIRTKNAQVIAVETQDGDVIETRTVLCNASAVGAYLELLDSTPPELAARLRSLPLQSPGVVVYLAVRGDLTSPYLRFNLTDAGCQLLVAPAAVQAITSEWQPARLIAPLAHHVVLEQGPSGEQRHLDQLLSAAWWQRHCGDYRVLRTTTARQWASEFFLHNNSMNPVMTASFMRRGRMPHKSPYVKGLYFAGSSTHPGQWVSFCAISGVLAAQRLLADLTSDAGNRV
jgi:phytoene dehydrogenase-like protein